jgi:5-oxopent-3-ene-1,2,5-tricarboxylate decarboxylase/2-hydroxyhepta-2,4-diene-1,7-dioate isomerase
VSVLDGPREERRRILAGGVPTWVRVDGDRLVLPDGRTVAEADAIHLAPCEPTKILCIHLNYESRRIEFRAPALVTPTYFQKPVTALNAHRGLLLRPAGSQYLNYEGEIAAIVGRPMKNVTPDEVWDCLAGFAPANDVGCQDFRDTDSGSMLRVKGMDGFCPIGPGIVRGVDVRASTVRTRLNGSIVQEGPVSEMVFGIDYQLADLARHITLVPGDVVLTGTPANSRPMKPGDVVEVEVTGLGRLSNTVAEFPAPRTTVGHQATDSDGVRRVALGGDYVPSRSGSESRGRSE